MSVIAWVCQLLFAGDYTSSPIPGVEEDSPVTITLLLVHQLLTIGN